MNKKRHRTIKIDDGKPWLCENGHLMGVMKRERIGQFKGYILYFLILDIASPEKDLPLKWSFRAEGTVHDLICKFCECEKTWWAGRAALNNMSPRNRNPSGSPIVKEGGRYV